MDNATVYALLSGAFGIITVGHVSVIVSLSRKLFRARRERDDLLKADEARRDHLKRIASSGARAANAAKKAKKDGQSS